MTRQVIALMGNPNVGKSTLFNALTHSRQHTGNWPGKTVSVARGTCESERYSYELVDLPGTYSLHTKSPEEEVARDFLLTQPPDAAVVVCDGACLERNLNLALQVMELCPKTLVCVNLLDEAKRRGIRVDLKRLSQKLGVPVIGTSIRDETSSLRLLTALDDLLIGRTVCHPKPVPYPVEVERELTKLERSGVARFQALRQLSEGEDAIQERLVTALVRQSESIARSVVRQQGRGDRLDRRLDAIFTSRRTGYPVMLLLLAFLFWLTIVGANYPSAWLSTALFWLQDRLTQLFHWLGAPDWIHGVLVEGAYRTLAWVISVMLPPMAIFFPLFTLLEDAGYLPRVAFNLDCPFRCCHACGKQALTMAMGFGCNAVGVTGCRIIDSPRERLLAILTNSFAPCNGRFPTIVALLTMFFVGTSAGAFSSVASALLLTLVILLGVGATFFTTWFLSVTVLKGVPSSFALELPPYRRPQVGKVLVRALLDRTLFVLGRAAAVAAPAGAVLWVMANVQVGEVSLLSHWAAFLDPLGKLMGLDGVILMAFLLGLPANEIVLPIILMAYTAQGSLTELGSLAQMQTLLEGNGWTWVTAVCFILFSLMHWPCSTTLLTIRKETGSWGWTALSALLPTVLGFITCTLLCTFVQIIGQI